MKPPTLSRTNGNEDDLTKKRPDFLFVMASTGDKNLLLNVLSPYYLGSDGKQERSVAKTKTCFFRCSVGIVAICVTTKKLETSKLVERVTNMRKLLQMPQVIFIKPRDAIRIMYLPGVIVDDPISFKNSVLRGVLPSRPQMAALGLLFEKNIYEAIGREEYQDALREMQDEDNVIDDDDNDEDANQSPLPVLPVVEIDPIENSDEVIAAAEAQFQMMEEHERFVPEHQGVVRNVNFPVPNPPPPMPMPDIPGLPSLNIMMPAAAPAPAPHNVVNNYIRFQRPNPPPPSRRVVASVPERVALQVRAAEERRRREIERKELERRTAVTSQALSEARSTESGKRTAGLRNDPEESEPIVLLKDDMNCGLCLEKPATTCCIPCACLKSCFECINTWLNRASRPEDRKCPYCKTVVKELIKPKFNIDFESEVKRRKTDPVHMRKVAEELQKEAQILLEAAAKTDSTNQENKKE